MKNKLGKRALSLLLSALMVVTSLPLVALTTSAAIRWTPVASSDFSSVSSVSQDTAFTPPTYNGGNAISWTAHSYSSNGTPTVANSAVYVPDGYMYMNQYNGGNQTPVSGMSKFKIDFGFRFKDATVDGVYSSNNVTSGGKYCFMKIGVFDNNRNSNTAMSANCTFAQDAFGKVYSYEGDYYGTNGYNNSISTNSANLTTGTDYHYIVEYTGKNGYIRSYITDNSGNVVQNIFYSTDSIFLDNVSRGLAGWGGFFKIGDDEGNNYFRALEYRNITFYGDGTTDTSSMSNVEALKALMVDYENIVSTGNLYTNMSAAYTAYVNANKAYDAAVYGGDTSNLSTAYTNLQTAIANMQLWVKPTFDGIAYQHGTEAAGGYDKVVFCPSSPYNNFYKTVNRGYIDHSFYYPNYIVLAYDGSDIAPSFPVVYTRKNQSNPWGGNGRGMYAVTGWGTNLGLKENWRGYTDVNDASNYAYPGMNGSEIMGYTESYSTKHYMDNTGKARGFGNKMVYDGTGDTANYYEHLTSFSFNIRTEYYNETQQVDYSDANIYVINYSPISEELDALKAKLAVLDVTNYTQGGMANIFNAIDAFTADKVNPEAYVNGVTIGNDTYKFLVTYNGSSITENSVDTTVQKCATEIKAAYNTYKNAAEGAIDSNYNTLRSDMTDGLSNTYGAYGSVTAKQLFENNSYWSNKIANYDAFFTAYTNAKNHMAALPSNGYNTTTAASLAAALEDAFGKLAPKSAANTPTVEGVTFLGPEDTIKIASDETRYSGTVTYKLFYDGKATTEAADYSGTVAYNANTTYAPFSAKNHTSVTVVAKGTDNSTATGCTTDEVTKTFYYIGAPSISGPDANSLVPLTQTVTAAKSATNSGVNGYGNIEVKYSYDGENWNNYLIGNDISVFPRVNGVYPSVSTVQVQSFYTEDGKTSKSEIVSLTLARQSDFVIYADAAGKSVYNSNSIIYMVDTSNYQDDIIYQVYADGSQTPSAWFTYDKANGLNLAQSSDAATIINNARYVTIKAISRDKNTHSYNDAVTAVLYNAQDRNDLIYHESFNGTVSGTTYTSADDLGVTLNLGADGSLVENAGDTQGTGKGEAGTTTDYRKNVLKLAANTTTENYVTFNENPYADVVNKNFAKGQGVTISFWRAFNSDGTAGDLGTKSGWDIPNWRNVLSVRPSGAATTSDKYLRIEASAEVDYSVTGAQDYLNLLVNTTDVTTHSASTQKGYWEHIAVTFNPSGEVVVYVNGVPHVTNAYVDDGAKDTDDNNIYKNGVNAEYVSDVLDFITDSNNVFYFGHDNGWDMELQTSDLYIDDVRFYTNVLTQKQIWETYTDNYSDTPKLENNYTSVTHDPTTVTAYTVEGVSGTVGQEYIDLHPNAVITKREYYSFGTGMQIYYSTDNINWTIIGDSEGRVAYQNQDIFGAEYHEALYEVLNEIKNTQDASTAAGHLVWAPHVMYNVTTNKWMMYAAISYWGNCNSDIIALESSDGTPVHYKARNTDDTQAYQIIMRSRMRPNAIDACVFYGHNSDGSIDPNTVYMTYGAWSAWGIGEQGYDLDKDLYMTTRLNANGYVDSALDNVGTGQFEIAASQPFDTTGEGSYVIYKDGYYYLFAAYGVNEYNYMTRVYRSADPVNEGFVDYNGVDAKDETQFHGTQIMAPYYLPGSNYIYMSTGHNSVYKTVNNSGEEIYLNSTHARPVSNKANGYRALPDVAMATRQIGLPGNVTLTNPIFFTESGWPLVMPEQYNGTETSKNIVASDLDGIYSALTLYDIIDYNHEYSGAVKKDGVVSDNFNTSLKMMFAATSVREGRIYGSTAAGFMPINFTYKLNSVGNTTYIHIFDGSTEVAEGVAVLRNGVPELAYFNKNAISGLSSEETRAGATIWAKRIDVLPEADQESMGDSVSMDGVIYTHATDAEVLAVAGLNDSSSDADKAAARASGYAVYGQEISDNKDYGKTDANGNYISNGERYTTITVSYPAYIDTTQSNAIYCTNDDDYTSKGYLAGAFSLKPLNEDKWYSVDSNGIYTYYDSDAAAKTAYDNGADVKKLYMVQGAVSNYFAYDSTAGEYREGGVEFLVQYKNIETGASYGEYEYCYVTYNPAWAHTMAATRNLSKDVVAGVTTNDRRSSIGNFNRFVNSYGEATAYSSSLLYYAAKGKTENDGWGIGTSGYLTDFSNTATGKELNTLDKIETLFNSYDVSKGVTSGSYSVQEHEDSAPNSYIATPQLISTMYYVDYSDTDNYIKNNPNGLIMTTSDNTGDTPVGYQFKMETSNFLWDTTDVASIHDVTSYQVNRTGLKVSYSSSGDGVMDSRSLISLKNDDDPGDDAKVKGFMATNRPEYVTDANIWPAHNRRHWIDIEMLFHTDMRNKSNYLYDNDYRNKLITYFADGTTKQTTSPPYDDGWCDGTDKNGTAPYYPNYLNATAYSTASNGKDATNNWQGVAVFSGKNSVPQRTASDLKALNGVNGLTYDENSGKLYDGYYYYYTTNDYNHEGWASTAEAAQAKTGYSSHGKLDVTAENLANYILELGTYHKVNDTGVDGGRFVGNETYHYYNIGVATCDKGAARTFAETYLNKNLKVDKDGKVVLDSNGVPTIEERTAEDGTKTTSINSGEYSIASYKAYLDAIAECYWFVENPRNTTFADFEDSGSTADTSYTTAYSNDGTPIYVTDKTGNNIFKDGETTTDEVQAQLIENVIKAYENLFNKEDYKEVEETYIEKNENRQTLSSDVYTQESIDFYNEILDLFKIECEYYTDKDAASDADVSGLDDIDGAGSYWRNVSLSGAEYKEILEALNSLDKVPMLKVDIDGTDNVNIVLDGDTTPTGSNLKSTVTAKTPAYNAGLGTKQSQNSTISAWLELKEAYENAQATVNTVENAESNNADLGRYKTESKSIVFSTKTLDYTVPVTDYSDLQVEINTENKALTNADVKAVDLDERYQNYNTAQSYTSKIDRTVYTQAALNNINALVNLGYSLPNGTESAPVYGEASDEIINNAVYVNYNNTVYKNTGLNETDAKTAYVLNTLNDVDAQTSGGNDNLVDCTVNFYKVVDGVTTQVSTQTVKFGSAVTLSYSGDATDEVISWVIEQNGASTAKKITTSSYVYYATAATANVYVNVFTENAQNTVNVTVKDYFDKAHTVSVPSGTTVSVNETSHALVFSDGTTVSAPKTAYINFTKWTVNGEDFTDGYQITEPVTFKAVGEKSDNTVTYTVSGGTFADGSTSAVYKADDKINITADGECVGIAVRTDTGYELVTYGSTYEFYGFPAGVIDNVEFLVVTDSNKAEIIGSDYDIGVFAPATYSGDRVVVYALATVGTLPEGVTVTERGILLTRGDHSDAGFVKGSDKSKAYLSTSDVTSSFYMISAKCTKPDGAYVRAYVSYNKTVTLAGTTATLPLVVYGKVYSVAELAN